MSNGLVLPTRVVNGTPDDATQVMQMLDYIMANLNNTLISPPGAAFNMAGQTFNGLPPAIASGQPITYDQVQPGGTYAPGLADAPADGNTYGRNNHAWVVASGGGGSTYKIRGRSLTIGVGSSYTIPFPAGAVAGDFAILICGHAYAINTVSGWTSVDLQSGGFYDGAIQSRVLTSGDISTGSVTVTTGASFSGTFALIVFPGTSSLRAFATTQNGTGSFAGYLNTTNSTPAAGDIALYFCMSRISSPVDVSLGVPLLYGTDQSVVTAVVKTELLGYSGAITTLSYGVGVGASTGATYNGIIVVKNS